MYKVKDMLYAKGFCYLKKKDANMVALSVVGNAEDWLEVEMILPLEVVVNGDYATWQNGLFAQNIKNKQTYDELKQSIIKSRYSIDDQIAIILNKEKGEEFMEAFTCMQDWRNFASALATSIIKVQNKMI